MMSQFSQPWITAVACILLAAAAGTAGGCAVRSAKHVARTREAWVEDEFVGRRITTDHFRIFSTLDDAEFEEALPSFLEAAYRQYEETFPHREPLDTKLTMYVFGTRSEWERFTRRRFPARHPLYTRIWSGGFTEGGVSVSFYVTRSATLATLAHEGWHQYVESRFSQPIPAWLNEGLACYHEAVEFVGNRPRFTPRHNTLRINSLREAVQTNRLMTVSQLATTHAGEILSRDDRRMTQTYYAQAWALVMFLRHGAQGRYAGGFQQLLSDLADGSFHVRVSAAQLTGPESGPGGTAEAVFRTYFDASPAALEDSYYDYLVCLSGF